VDEKVLGGDLDRIGVCSQKRAVRIFCAACLGVCLPFTAIGLAGADESNVPTPIVFVALLLYYPAVMPGGAIVGREIVAMLFLAAFWALLFAGGEWVRPRAEHRRS
jgi:hypothetical protein